MSFLKSLYTVLELDSSEEEATAPSPKRARTSADHASSAAATVAPLYLNKLQESSEEHSNIGMQMVRVFFHFHFFKRLFVHFLHSYSKRLGRSLWQVMSWPFKIFSNVIRLEMTVQPMWFWWILWLICLGCVGSAHHSLLYHAWRSCMVMVVMQAKRSRSKGTHMA